VAIAQVDTDDFGTAVLESDVPVVVDFYATWCGPCRLITPILEELSGRMDSVRFVKVDIDESPDVAQKYAVTGVPTLVVFKGGEEADRKVGALPKPALESWVQQYGG